MNVCILFCIRDRQFIGSQQEQEVLTEEQRAIPYAMEAIRLLFAEWFIEGKNVNCVKDAMQIYYL